MFRKNFEHDWYFLSLYSTCSKEILHCIRALFPNPLVHFCENISLCTNPEIWFIVLSLETIQISGRTDFIWNSHINVLSKHFLSKWMHFKWIQFCLRESCSKLETCYIKTNRWKIPEHIFTDFIFMLLHLECTSFFLQRENLMLLRTCEILICTLKIVALLLMLTWNNVRF